MHIVQNVLVFRTFSSIYSNYSLIFYNLKIGAYFKQTSPFYFSALKGNFIYNMYNQIGFEIWLFVLTIYRANVVMEAGKHALVNYFTSKFICLSTLHTHPYFVVFKDIIHKSIILTFSQLKL